MADDKKTYDEAEIKSRLAGELRHWTYADGHIQRVYKTGGWKGTLMVVNAVGYLAEAAWHHPDLHASYPAVVVKLMSHDLGGITDKDFELARKIEAVVQWQPGTEGGALEGTPADPRFTTIQYD